MRSAIAFMIGWIIGMLLFNAVAKAEGHQTYSNNRNYLKAPYLWDSRLEAQSANLQTGSEVIAMRGAGFKSAFGTELERFARFLVVTGYRDVATTGADSLRGPDLNLEVRLNFGSPVVNVEFGLGGGGAVLARQVADRVEKYGTSGIYGTFGIERFVASQASLHLGVRGGQENVTGVKDADGNDMRSTITTSAITAGMTLWIK